MLQKRIEELRKQFIAENDGKSTIVLKGKYGKQQGPLVLYPVFNSLSERFLGVDEMNEEDRKKSIRPVTGETSRRVTESMTIDLKRDFDVIDWAWMKHSRQIAKNAKEAAQNNSALFYVYNEETVIKEQINKADLMFEAMSLVKNASATEKGQRVRLMIGSTTGFKELEIEQYLKEKAMNEPEKIIKLFQDKDLKNKIFIMDLVQAEILRKDVKDKLFYYEERPLGASIEAVVEYMHKEENKELVAHFALLLEEKK